MIELYKLFRAMFFSKWESMVMAYKIAKLKRNTRSKMTKEELIEKIKKCDDDMNREYYDENFEADIWAGFNHARSIFRNHLFEIVMTSKKE